MQARGTQLRDPANSAKSVSQVGASSRAAARLVAWLIGRAGLFVQHRRHRPSPFFRASAPQLEQGLGTRGRGGGREHGPHHPVPGRRKPGWSQRGHGCLTRRASRRRRQSRQCSTPGARTRWPHATQTREQRMHRPVSGWRRRNSSQPGQTARLAASCSAARHRWHRTGPYEEIPPLQAWQSATLTPAAWNGPGQPSERPLPAGVPVPPRLD